MTLDELENIERVALEMVVQALTDYKREAVAVFRREADLAQDIAEDLTREAIQEMGLPGFRHRLFGKVDFKKAVYVFSPEAHPVALMVDSKAEKTGQGLNPNPTIQMSQTSLAVEMRRMNKDVRVAGLLPKTISVNRLPIPVISIFAIYWYKERNGKRRLHDLEAVCLPNGKLQRRYNPHCSDGIWAAGRDAPTRGEKFRVRINREKLRNKADWRVKQVKLR